MRSSLTAMLERLVLAAALVLAAPAAAQTFPALSGRVVDAANLLDPAQEAELTRRLEALERASTRQLVVATVPSLEGHAIEDYGYRLGRHWGIGQSQANNGTILIVAPDERKVRIEVGYGLEPIVTDAVSSLIINERILPRFREGDMAGGIMAGADALIEQLGAPPEQAEQRALEAAQRVQARRARPNEGGGGSLFPVLFWLLILFFVIVPLLRRGRRGRRYGRRRRGWGGWGPAPIMIWGGGFGGGGGGWSGGGLGGGGGFGGFSGGGGSFGGGGASGSW